MTITFVSTALQNLIFVRIKFTLHSNQYYIVESTKVNVNTVSIDVLPRGLSVRESEREKKIRNDTKWT